MYHLVHLLFFFVVVVLPERKRSVELCKRENKARFKRRATAVPNTIDRIKFDFSTAVARRLKPSRATAV